MTADSGGSSHFIDNQLLPGIEHKMNHYVLLDPPVIVNVAGNHRLYGVGQGVLVVQVLNQRGSLCAASSHGSTRARQAPIFGGVNSYERGHYDHRH